MHVVRYKSIISGYMPPVVSLSSLQVGESDVEIGTKAAHFPEKEYRNGTFLSM
jgi:hypothetical protein